MYLAQLARELADFLKDLLPRHNGLMTLVDVYCFFNRARGAAGTHWHTQMGLRQTRMHTRTHARNVHVRMQAHTHVPPLSSCTHPRTCRIAVCLCVLMVCGPGQP
jgi:hypothetical protein